jgi:NADH dehydrogenase FAD-containing subunit
MSKHLVLVGGGHAHMMTLANLDQFITRGHTVTVIGPSEHHYYSGMGPGMLGQTYTPGEIRFATRHVVEKQGGQFILDKVERIDPQTQHVYLATGDRVTYDVLSCNAGSYVPVPAIEDASEDIFTVKPIERLMQAQKRLLDRMSKRSITVGIVGGGPSAAEVAGNVWGLAHKQGLHPPLIQILAGTRFMSHFPASVGRSVAASLTQRGVQIITAGYAEHIDANQVTLASGETYAYDFIFLALGVKPSPIFTASGLPTGPDGGLRVNHFLQSTAYPNIFGGGDCIFYQDQPLDKVGVYAVRQNPVLLHNLKAQLAGEALMPFDPGGDYLLIFNLGGGFGVLRKHWLQFGGRLAFSIKDYIDRKFMQKFQAIE